MSLPEIYTTLKKINKKVFTSEDIAKAVDYQNEKVLLNIKIQRLVISNVLKRIKRNLFCLYDTELSSLQLGNLLYTPSYISFETALNYYGILIQVPTVVTSASLKRSKEISYNSKFFSYTHISADYFGGYSEQDQALIASKEKALFDMIFHSAMGKRSFNFDELNREQIDKVLFSNYSKNVKNKAFINLCKRLNLC